MYLTLEVSEPHRASASLVVFDGGMPRGTWPSWNRSMAEAENWLAVSFGLSLGELESDEADEYGRLRAYKLTEAG